MMGSYTANNDTSSCDNNKCRISCQSPSFGPLTCYEMQQNFLDGTPCTGGGKCSNGVCKGGSFGNEVKSWITQNKTLVIALASTLGGIIVLSLLCCCTRRWSRRRSRERNMTPQPPLLVQSSMRDMNNAQWASQHPNRDPRSRGNQYAAYGAGGQMYFQQSRDMSGARSGRDQLPVYPGPTRQATGGWRNDGRWDPSMVVDRGGPGVGGGQQMPIGNWQSGAVRYA